MVPEEGESEAGSTDIRSKARTTPALISRARVPRSCMMPPRVRNLSRNPFVLLVKDSLYLIYRNTSNTFGAQVSFHSLNNVVIRDSQTRKKHYEQLK